MPPSSERFTHHIGSDPDTRYAHDRRKFLWASSLAALGLGLNLTGCSPNTMQMTGTFFQPWFDHLSWSKETWRTKFVQTKELGVRDITIQWVGEQSAVKNWRLPDETLKYIFDLAEELNLKIRLGLPYDSRWWQILGSKTDKPLLAFLTQTKEKMAEFIAQSRWQIRPAFLGWYIPYEIEQYSWSASSRRNLLVEWLGRIVDLSRAASNHTVAISTYQSAMASEASLADLWGRIIKDVALRPMIQDGAGVEGITNYARLEPLRDLFNREHITFDLVLELFEQDNHQSHVNFKARSASVKRIEQQLKLASSFGAEQLVSFALEPYVLGDSAEARLLFKNWPK